jgi:Single-strand binding protein family
VWRSQAEHLADSLAKGDRVMVTGRLRQRSWEIPEGDKRSVTEIEADEVGASLKWATAKVERTRRRGNGERNRAGSGPPSAAATSTINLHSETLTWPAPPADPGALVCCLVGLLPRGGRVRRPRQRRGGRGQAGRGGRPARHPARQARGWVHPLPTPSGGCWTTSPSSGRTYSRSCGCPACRPPTGAPNRPSAPPW